jgi:hypothetical protein
MMADNSVQLDAGFPGGNIAVEEIAGDVARVCQELRDTEGWWFYWAFRVRGARGRTLRFEFTDGEPVGVRGPAVSTDGGASWRWLGAESGDARSFTYRFAEGEDDVRFSFGIPYQQADWERFLHRRQGHRQARPGVLCSSRHGRPVEYLAIDPLDEPLHRVALTSRHHCCEAMATHALEGLLDAVLDAATPAARWLARHVGWLAVPFVDKDGAEEGDQGKNRRPRDHGRDYAGASIYPETAALRALLPRWSAGGRATVIDLHCPWIRGPHNEVIYQVGSADARRWDEQQHFGALLEQACRGPLPYRAADNLPFGEGSWNNAANYAGGMSLCRWAATETDAAFVTSFELPYANAGGVPVTPAAARAFGADLARALYAYLIG